MMTGGREMHEMSLCEGIMQVLEEQAQQQGFSRVELVRLEIGALAGVEIESMRFCFEVIARGTIADRARLEIIELPGEAWCPACARKVALRQRFDACPGCGGYQLQVSAGEEMTIKELEVS